MLMERGDGTFDGGEADFICILRLPSGTYHATVFEEHPLPGPVKPISELTTVRVKSKMHHTVGSPTFEGAQKHVEELRDRIVLPDENVVSDEALEVDDSVSNRLLPNWTRGGVTLKEALFSRAA